MFETEREFEIKRARDLLMSYNPIVNMKNDLDLFEFQTLLDKLVN